MEVVMAQSDEQASPSRSRSGKAPAAADAEVPRRPDTQRTMSLYADFAYETHAANLDANRGYMAAYRDYVKTANASHADVWKAVEAAARAYQSAISGEPTPDQYSQAYADYIAAVNQAGSEGRGRVERAWTDYIRETARIAGEHGSLHKAL